MRSQLPSAVCRCAPSHERWSGFTERPFVLHRLPRFLRAGDGQLGLKLTGVGYNFRSLQHISPFLEPTAAGITSLWARTTALKHNCVVTAGYPEKVDVSPKWPAGPEYYNSAITVNAEGETIANYRKSFLYYTDETWALEGPESFYSGEIAGFGKVAMGICKWPAKSFERVYVRSASARLANATF